MGVFCEVKLYQVKPSKVDEFEAFMTSIVDDMRSCEGCISMKLMKRFYVFDEMDKPPRQLARVVKCVKFYGYWEFDSIEAYTEANKWFFDHHAKAIQKMLIMPFSINCGMSLC